MCSKIQFKLCSFCKEKFYRKPEHNNYTWKRARYCEPDGVCSRRKTAANAKIARKIKRDLEKHSKKRFKIKNADIIQHLLNTGKLPQGEVE